MISTVIAFLGTVGGRLGLSWVLGWLSPLKAVAGWIGPLVTAAIEVTQPLLAALVGLVLEGLRHIVKSVPATGVLLALMWGSYAYGKLHTQPKTSTPAKVERPLTGGRSKPDKDWRDRVLGD